MKKDSPWYLALWCVVGVAIGIVFVGVLTSVVHWAGTEKFCGEFCHSMDATYVAYQKGDHFRTASGATAGCSDCHLKNESNHFAGPIDYTALLIDKAIAGSKSLFGEIAGHLSTPEKQIEMRQEMAEAGPPAAAAMTWPACTIRSVRCSAKSIATWVPRLRMSTASPAIRPPATTTATSSSSTPPRSNRFKARA